MRDRELIDYFRDFRQVPSPVKMQETMDGCKQIMREGLDTPFYALGFLDFLVDIFHMEGLALAGGQLGTLFLVCMALRAASDFLNLVPVTIPFFVLAALPALFKSETYRMSEIEAVTKSSNVQLVLARMVIVAASDLFSFTLLLLVELHFVGTGENLVQMILHVLVPYIFCAGMVLYLLRKKGTPGYRNCVWMSLASSGFWGITSIALPAAYQVSAVGLWIVFFLIFSAFMIREIKEAVAVAKEGRIYGVVA